MTIPLKVKELFNRQSLVAVGTADKNGVPNVSVVFWKQLLDGDTILLIDNFMKTTKENIKVNENICISFWNSETEEAYKIKGVATYHAEGPFYDKGTTFIQSKKRVECRKAL